MRSRSPPYAARARQGRELTVKGAKENNLRNIDVSFPLGLFVVGHRRVRLGQVHAGQRHPLHLAGQADLQRPRRARPAPDHHRPRPRRQGHPRRPVADRPHAAVQPGDLHRRLRPHPQAVRLHPGGQDARLPAGPVLVQRQGRPLRGVLGRRHDQDRDELPAGRLRPVRGLPRRPLQPRDARGALQGQDHRRDPRHADRGGRRLLRRGPRDRAAHDDARARSASATSASASRRRRSPAARRSGSSCRRSCRSARPAAPSTSSTSRRPACTSRTSASCCCVLAGWSTRATPSW